jgi:hypothetical protein
MNDMAPNNRDPGGDNGSGDELGTVESYAGDNVVTITATDGGDNTIGPAPEHLRKHLQEYRRRRGIPEPPAAG